MPNAAPETKRAQWRKYKRSAKGKAADARRYHTDAYRAWNKLRRKRRIQLGSRYLGTAQTIESTNAIRQHIKVRRDEFKQGQQARAEAEGAPPGTVQVAAAV